MYGMELANSHQRVYRLKWWVQVWYLTWGVFMSGIVIFFVGACIAEGDWSYFVNWKSGLTALVGLFVGYYFFALALRSRVELDDRRISVRYAINEDSADLTDIEGYRISISVNASFWLLVLKDNKGYISIMRSFCVDEKFNTFLAQLKHLNQNQSASFTSKSR